MIAKYRQITSATSRHNISPHHIGYNICQCTICQWLFHLPWAFKVNHYSSTETHMGLSGLPSATRTTPTNISNNICHKNRHNICLKPQWSIPHHCTAQIYNKKHTHTTLVILWTKIFSQITPIKLWRSTFSADLRKPCWKLAKAYLTTKYFLLIKKSGLSSA